MQILRACTQGLWKVYLNPKPKLQSPCFKRISSHGSLCFNRAHNPCWVAGNLIQTSTYSTLGKEEKGGEQEEAKVLAAIFCQAKPLRLEDGLRSNLSLQDLACLLEKCRKDKDQAYGMRLLAHIRKCGLEAHSTLGNRLVSMLVEIGSMHDAHEVFNKLSFRNEGSLTSLIIGYTKWGMPHHALTLYQKMQQEYSVYPSAPALVALLKACTKLKDLNYGVKLHAEVARMGLLDRNIFIGSVLVDMYVKCGLLLQAREVFDKLSVRNVVSWTTLISGYVEHGDGMEALQCFEQMTQNGVAPNCVTFVCILKACTSIRDMDRGRVIHVEIERQGLLEKHSAIGNTLVDMYAKCGLLAMAQQVFDKLSFRNAVSWTALISGYVEHGLGEEALFCFEDMQLEGVAPDVVTFVCSLKACVILGAMDKGQEIHAEIERQGVLERNMFVGSALIDMYAKLGVVEKAQEVFDRFPAQSVVAWNALIAGYIEHGNDEKALDCFLQMEYESVPPDYVTFVCSLKACGQLGDTDLGKEIHAEIERQGLLGKHLVIGNTLVDMYARCHLLALAQQVFDKLPIQDVISWNALIAGYVEDEHDAEALDFSEQMQLEGVFPDAVTLLCGLRACGNVGAMDKGHELHMVIEKQGLLKSEALLSSMVVDMYAKNGWLSTAQRVFDRLSIRNVASWNALITGYAEYGHGEKALECFEQLQYGRVSPDVVTYMGILKACASIGATDIGKRIHLEIERDGLLETNHLVGNALVDMYAKCGLYDKATHVFDRLPLRDVVSWTALVAGYVEHGHGEEALDCIEQMQLEGVYPSIATLVCGLKACAIIGDPEKGQELHTEIESRGLLERDSGVGNSLVDMYAECGMLAIAQKVFDKLPDRDVVSWTALIARYAEHGYFKEALACFEHMQHEGISPDVVTFVCSLKACGGVGTTKMMRELHAEIIRKHLFEGNLFVSSTLVDMYTKCGWLKKARQVFDKLPVQNSVAWNILIAGYAEHGQGEEALDCLEEMRRKGISPDMATFVCCLQACGSIGAIDKGLELHAEIERQGLLEGDLIGNTLVDMYAKCGALAKAQQVMGMLPVRDVVTWTALMRGYAHAGESENVFLAFERMRGEHIKPDPVTFIVVLSACSRAGLFNESWTYFEAMSKSYGIVPTLEHHACVVDLMSRSGQLDEAAATIKKLPFCASPVVWHTVLGACRNLGSVELAKEAFKHAMLLDEKDSAAYVLMSHTCAGDDVLENTDNVEAVNV